MRHLFAGFAPRASLDRRFALAVTVALVLCAAVLPATVSANHDTKFDEFDHSTFPELIAGAGAIPNTGVNAYVTETTYDSSLYTLESGELERPGCPSSDGTYHFGGRTGWIRFLPPVAGKITITADTGYDSIIWLWQMGDTRPAGMYDVTDLADGTFNLNCSDGSLSGTFGGAVEETIVQDIQANRTAFVLSAGHYCNRPPNTCPDAGTAATAPGGETKIRITFVPLNTDGDGVPDTRDACPTQRASTPSGCPDRDLDGVEDRHDRCPDVKGDPPLGCPPPDNDRDGVTIASDCNDSNPAVKPGATPIPGNGVDDDCDGKPDQFGLTIAETTLSFRDTRNGIRVRSLVLRNVTAGGRVELTCKRGRRRACRKQVRKSAAQIAGAKASSTVNFRALRGRRLRAGTRIEIRITKKHSIGRYIQYRVRRGGFKRTDRCMNAGSRKPRSRCTTSAL